jgi:phage FluMu protein Com
MQLQTIKCTKCGKALTRAIGEVEMPCKRCGFMVHVIVTSKGIIDLNKPLQYTEETVIK